MSKSVQYMFFDKFLLYIVYFLQFPLKKLQKIKKDIRSKRNSDFNIVHFFPKILFLADYTKFSAYT